MSRVLNCALSVVLLVESAMCRANQPSTLPSPERPARVDELRFAEASGMQDAAKSEHEIEEIVVSGTRREGYIVGVSDALGVPLETSKIPASVSILSDDLLEDLGARDLGAVLTYVPGVANADDGGVNRQLFNVRGFAQTETYINGIRQSMTAEGVRAIDTIDRVQIMKGPSGVEASLTSPGGFVNIITKKPQETFSATTFLSAGDHSFFRVGGDITGPIFGDRVAGRLITAYERKQWWRGGQDDRPVLTVAPSLSWRLQDSTQLLVEYEFSKQNDPLDRGVIYIEGAGLKGNFLPRSFTFHGNDDDLKATNHRFDVSLRHEFNDVLSGRVAYQHASQSVKEQSFRNANSEGGGSLFLSDGITYSGNPLMDIYFAQFGSDVKSETYQADLTAQFTTGSARNIINVGASKGKNEDIFKDHDSDFVYGDFLNSIDVFNPDNDQQPTLLGTYVWPNFVRGDEIDSVFGQWVGEWTTRFRTVASLRRDKISFFQREDITGIGAEQLAELASYYAPDPIPLFSDGYGDTIISYRLGSSYDLTEALTAFIGYSKAGEPQQGLTRSGAQVSPARATAYEGGVKWELAGGRALLTATAYHLVREDIAISDPTNLPSENFLIPLGSAKMTGVEVELIGKLSEDISIFGGFSLQDSEITRSEEDIAGNRFANIPDFQASVFVNYNARPLGLSGLDMSLGVVHQGDREGNSANQYELPAYTRLDAAVGYTFSNNLEVRFNVKNLLDETYYTAAQDSIFGADQVAVGDRRLFQVTTTKRF